jgi:hypothetical protein
MLTTLPPPPPPDYRRIGLPTATFRLVAPGPRAGGLRAITLYRASAELPGGLREGPSPARRQSRRPSASHRLGRSGTLPQLRTEIRD